MGSLRCLSVPVLLGIFLGTFLAVRVGTLLGSRFPGAVWREGAPASGGAIPGKKWGRFDGSLPSNSHPGHSRPADGNDATEGSPAAPPANAETAASGNKKKVFGVTPAFGGQEVCPAHSAWLEKNFDASDVQETEARIQEWIAVGAHKSIEKFQNKVSDGSYGDFNRLGDDEREYLRHQVYKSAFGGAIGPTCKSLTLVSDDRLDKKYICGADTLTTEPSSSLLRLFFAAKANRNNDCKIFSLGSNNNWVFEEQVHAGVLGKRGCTIETFDCTSSAKSMPRGISDSTRFHQLCVGSAEQQEQSRAKGGLPFVTWEGAVEQGFGASKGDGELSPAASRARTPTVLKMDIEGHEYDVFDSIRRAPDSAQPRLILLELHHRTNIPTSWTPVTMRKSYPDETKAKKDQTTPAPNPGQKPELILRTMTPGEMWTFMLGMLQAGYRMVNADYAGTHCPHCLEVVLVKFYCKAAP